jgi:hypothetical protein
MPYKDSMRKIAIPRELSDAIAERIKREGLHASTTQFIWDVLGWFLSGSLVRKPAEEVEGGLIVAAKIESKAARNERAKAS